MHPFQKSRSLFLRLSCRLWVPLVSGWGEWSRKPTVEKNHIKTIQIFAVSGLWTRGGRSHLSFQNDGFGMVFIFIFIFKFYNKHILKSSLNRKRAPFLVVKEPSVGSSFFCPLETSCSNGQQMETPPPLLLASANQLVSWKIAMVFAMAHQKSYFSFMNLGISVDVYFITKQFCLEKTENLGI